MVPGWYLTPEPSRLGQGQGNVTVKLPKWTLHEGARPRPSWKSRQPCREHPQHSQSRAAALTEPTALPTGSRASAGGTPVTLPSHPPPSWAPWGSQKQRLMSRKATGPGESRTPPRDRMLGLASGSWAQGRALNRIQVPIKDRTWPWEAKDEIVFRADLASDWPCGRASPLNL